MIEPPPAILLCCFLIFGTLVWLFPGAMAALFLATVVFGLAWDHP